MTAWTPSRRALLRAAGIAGTGLSLGIVGAQALAHGTAPKAPLRKLKVA